MLIIIKFYLNNLVLVPLPPFTTGCGLYLKYITETVIKRIITNMIIPTHTKTFDLCFAF